MLDKYSPFLNDSAKLRQRPRTADGSINDDVRKRKEIRRARLEKYREALRSNQCYGCATAVLSTIVVLLIMCMACILYVKKYIFVLRFSHNEQQQQIL
jgi:Flp pilus assembly protein TadB